MSLELKEAVGLWTFWNFNYFKVQIQTFGNLVLNLMAIFLEQVYKWFLELGPGQCKQRIMKERKQTRPPSQTDVHPRVFCIPFSAS